ncbi:MAG: NnrS family protein [Gammaproteobacteria bacterium]
MALLNIETGNTEAERRLALFDLGFRPFFLLAGISAVVLVAFWVYDYATGSSESNYYPAIVWHGHEMIFGYSVAVIAGFLLTAVRNWTGLQTPGGYPLAGLVLLWLAGRVSALYSGVLPHWSIAFIDLAFLPVLAIVLSVPLLRKRQKHNLVFLLVLMALTVANVLVHLQLLGLTEASASQGLNFAIYVIVFLVSVLGGRVIPFFTETAIPAATARKWPSVEMLSLGSLVVLMGLDLLAVAPVAIMLVAILAALAHGVRLFGWYHRRVLLVPLLWVLHLGYAWLVVGFALKALAAAGLINPMLALHAFTTAGIGTMTLGMMARVALGHTGRELRIGRWITLSFVLANLAAVARVLLPVMVPQMYNDCVVLAGVLWSAAFAIFVFNYAGILVRPRLDGRPG